MEFLSPATWEEALAAKSARPDAVPITGGTDVMVELNFNRRRPPALLNLTRVPRLRQWCLDSGVLCLGAGVTCTQILENLRETAPGLAAQRTEAATAEEATG